MWTDRMFPAEDSNIGKSSAVLSFQVKRKQSVIVISYLKAAFKLALQSQMLKYLIIFLRDHEAVPWVKTEHAWI